MKYNHKTLFIPHCFSFLCDCTTQFLMKTVTLLKHTWYLIAKPHVQFITHKKNQKVLCPLSVSILSRKPEIGSLVTRTFCSMSDLSITAEQESQWRNQGFTVVDGLDVTQARAEAKFTKNNSGDGFGSKDGGFEVPCGTDSVDLLAFRVLRVAKKLLRSDDVMLSQADVWIKFPKPASDMSNDDQRIHCDYGNNTVLPTDWHKPNVMAAIIYLDSDGVECKGGATAAVPRRGDDDPDYHIDKMVVQPGYGDRKFLNSRPAAEEWMRQNRPEDYAFRQGLYAREVKVLPRQGRVLLYRVDLWHRGTPLESGSRRVMNLVYHLRTDPGHGGRWNQGFFRDSYWIRNGKWGVPERLWSEVLTPEYRTGLGFPPLGHPYWSKERLRLMKLRFPRFDIEPYLAAMPEALKSRPLITSRL